MQGGDGRPSPPRTSRRACAVAWTLSRLAAGAGGGILRPPLPGPAPGAPRRPEPGPEGVQPIAIGHGLVRPRHATSAGVARRLAHHCPPPLRQRSCRAREGVHGSLILRAQACACPTPCGAVLCPEPRPGARESPATAVAGVSGCWGPSWRALAREPTRGPASTPAPDLARGRPLCRGHGGPPWPVKPGDGAGGRDLPTCKG